MTVYPERFPPAAVSIETKTSFSDWTRGNILSLESIFSKFSESKKNKGCVRSKLEKKKM